MLKKRSFVCSGCGWKVKSTKEKHCRQLSFVVDKKRQTTNICNNCQLDVSTNDIQYSEMDSDDIVSEQGQF